jgi:hypothetical protein
VGLLKVRDGSKSVRVASHAKPYIGSAAPTREIKVKAFIDRLFGRSKDSGASGPAGDDTVPDVASSDVPIFMLRERIRSDVAMGFYDEDVILKDLPGHFEDEIDPAVIRREAPHLLRQALAEHAAAEAIWPAVTDCDRIDAAFAELEEAGVIARQNYSCCMTCGSAEIFDEMVAAQDAGAPVRGYAFYHVQDTEAAIEGRGIHLGYGAAEEGEAAALAIGREIVATLEAHGLRTDWNGSWDRRIGVALDWKRRRGVAR